MSGSPLASSPLAVQRGILGAVLLVVCWEGLARGLHLPSYVLPAVSEILAGVWSKRALLGEAAGYTVLEALVGYGLGCLIGIALAVAITMLPPLRAVILPAATAINSVPVVAYSPQRHRGDHHRNARRLWRARLGDLPGRAADRLRAGLVGDLRCFGGEPEFLRPDRLPGTQNPVLDVIR